MPREMEWSPTTVPPSVASEGVPVNLLHMELLHHFERFTMPTLCWQEVWPTMLQLAFRVRPTPPPSLRLLRLGPWQPRLLGVGVWEHTFLGETER